MSATSNSSRANVPVTSLVREWFALFGMRIRGLWKRDDFEQLFSQVADYRERLLELSGVDLSHAKVLEVGYGQRPNRLRALMSMNINAVGLDLDKPVLRGSFSEFVDIGRRNGLQRMLKSWVRHHLFDGREHAQLADALRKRGYHYHVDLRGFMVGNVASEEVDRQIADGSLDLIFSEDVFEHIPKEELLVAVSRMNRWLKPSGLALIRLTLFTGITGGHYTDWYPHTLKQTITRRTEPWEHLRQRRFSANTYLNELRIDDYIKLFSKNFEIIDIVKDNFGMGADFLTPRIHEDLSAYTTDELLTNEVFFVLKPMAIRSMH